MASYLPKPTTGLSQRLPITAIVMTYNEERNLDACLASLVDHVDEIIVVDSESTDRTEAIARRYTDRFIAQPFVNYSDQFNWGLAVGKPRNEWIARVDADERWTPEGFAELAPLVADPDVHGIYVRMKIYFMHRWIRWGGNYPNLFLRVYRLDRGEIEKRWMDEHIRVDGNVHTSKIDVIEANYDRQDNIGLWTKKHNSYSTREAVENLIQRHRIREMDSVADLRGTKVQRKRWLKEHLYVGFPLFLRPFVYYLYRYIFQLGFLDGKEGFIYHYLHAFWYRFLVDTKVYQLERHMRKNKLSAPQVIREHYGIDIGE